MAKKFITDFIAGATGAVYFGPPATDGSWRVTRNGADLILEKRVAGSWVEQNQTADATGGRLTLSSGVPVPAADVTAAGTLYYTPYTSGLVRLYNGTRWLVYSFSELSLGLVLTSAKNYDVFLYDNAGTLTLELSAAWTTDTARADALALQDGIKVKSGAVTRRWLGTIRASGTNICEDSSTKRFVDNAYNRVFRVLRSYNTNTSWTFDGTGGTREYNAGSGQLRGEVVLGSPRFFSAIMNGLVTVLTDTYIYDCDIGYDSTTSPLLGGYVEFYKSVNVANPLIQIGPAVSQVSEGTAGYHYFTQLEYTNVVGSGTNYPGGGSYSLLVASFEN